MGTIGTALNAASLAGAAWSDKRGGGGLADTLAAADLSARAARKELEADRALELGELEQLEQMADGRRERAARRVAYAAAGVRVDAGSAAAVAADMAAWSEYDRQKLAYRAEAESWGLRQDAALLRRDAARARLAAAAGGGDGGGLSGLAVAGKLFGLMSK